MKKKPRYRLYWVLLLLLAAIVAACLVVYALGENVNFYFTPSQVAAGQAPKGRLIRVGGKVVVGSVHRQPQSLAVRFQLSDGHSKLWVHYHGVLPVLFRVGQGIVVEGKMQPAYLQAVQVLAKHDADYKPPGAAAAWQRASAKS